MLNAEEKKQGICCWKEVAEVCQTYETFMIVGAAFQVRAVRRRRGGSSRGRFQILRGQSLHFPGSDQRLPPQPCS